MKLAGGIMLFLAALYYSICKQRQEKTKLDILTELCDLFGYLQKNIECFSSPLGDLYRAYSSPTLAQLGFYETWREASLEAAVAVLTGGAGNPLPEGAEKTMRHYSERAGQGYKEEELQLCRYTRDALQEELQRAQKNSAGKRRMYRTMPFLLVLSVVLLFW